MRIYNFGNDFSFQRMQNELRENDRNQIQQRREEHLAKESEIKQNNEEKEEKENKKKEKTRTQK